jgi:hypothetical protein
MLDGLDHFIQTSEFSYAVNVVLAAGKIGCWQSFFRQLAPVRAAANNGLGASSTEILESLLG